MNRLHVVLVFVIFSILTCTDYLVLLIAMPIMYLAGRELSKIKVNSFTPADMFWFCILLYFGVVPPQSFRDGHFWKSTTAALSFSYVDLIVAMAIAILFCITFLWAKKRAFKNSVERINIPSSSREKYKSSMGYMIFLFGLSVVSMLLYISFSGGLSNVLSARVDKDMESYTVVGALCLALSVAANFYLVDLYKNSTGRIIGLNLITVFCLGVQLLCLNPYNSARFFLVASWLPIVLLLFEGKVGYKTVYLFIALGIFLVMPILSVTTRFGTQGSDEFVVDFSDLFKIKDVDIFETLVYMVNYIEHIGYQFGQNILAIILFFVPRNWWSEKPIMGGLNIGWDLYDRGVANTPNLSFFIGGDLFMDFSWWGVAIGGYFLGYIFYKLLLKTRPSGQHYIEGFVLISILPILLRGPVGAVIGFPMCLMVSTRLLNLLKQSIHAQSSTTPLVGRERGIVSARDTLRSSRGRKW